MTIPDYITQAHENAKEKGWWDKPPEFGTLIALCHSELSEALEAAREGKPWLYCADLGKPEGVAVELADVLIRIFDMCGGLHIPLADALEIKMAYNKTRPHMHGGKRF